MKQCVLQPEKACTACGDCNRCDLNPEKICDNCCACIDHPLEQAEDIAYAQIPVTDIVQEEPDAYLEAFYQEEEEDTYTDTAASMPYEQPDPALLAHWEAKLKELEQAEAPVLRGVRKRREH